MTEPTVATQEPAGSAEDKQSKHSPLRKTVGDIVRSMGIVGGIIAVVLIVTWRPQPDPVREVDAAPVAAAAAAAADFEVLYPRVPEGWRATSARFEPTRESGDDPVWFNGWVTADDQYVAVVQSQAGNRRFIEEQTASSSPAVDVPPGLPATVAGWDPYVSDDGTQRSLVRTRDGVTTIVTGTQDWAGVAAFADMLRPVAPPE